MSPVRVLLLTQVLPYPPHSGPQIKTLAVLRALASEHEVTVASFVRGDESAAVRRLEQSGVRVHTVPIQRGRGRDLWHGLRSLASATPFLIARDERADMHRLVQRLASQQRFDIVHADQLNMAQYAWPLAGVRQVLDLHNALWVLTDRLAGSTHNHALRPLLRREAALLRGYEAEACRRSDAVLTVSNEDREALLSAARQSGVDLAADRLHVVPIALDPELIPSTMPTSASSRSARVLHLGTLAWPPNVDGLLWLLREVWPSVRQRQPDATLDVIGQRPPRQVRQLAARLPGVRVLGYVDDVDAALRDAALLAVPLHSGSGMRVKILTALAHGLPIVTTTLGAEGIAITHGTDALVADGAAEFADAMLHVLQTPALGAQLAANGRQLLAHHYDARLALAPMLALYRRLGEGRAS